MARDGASKFLSRVASGGDRRGIAVFYERRDVLWDISEHAQRRVARDRNDRAGAGGAGSDSRWHQVSGIDVARGDNPVEWRCDRFVLLVGQILVKERARLK